MYSLLIALCSSILGVVGGTALAWMQLSYHRVLRAVAKIYIFIIRGSPMLVQIMFLFYVCPQVGIHMSPIIAAITAMGLNSSAYLSQVIRVGVQSIDPLELEAAQGIGMTRAKVLSHVVAPQTWRAILPALGNEITTLIKDSSLASVVGVVELTKVGAIIRARSYDAFSSIVAIALVYLILTLIFQKVIHSIEIREKKPCSW